MILSCSFIRCLPASAALFLTFMIIAGGGHASMKIGEVGSWTIGLSKKDSAKSGDHNAAYVLSHPKKSEGNYTSRGDTYCLVTLWGNRDITLHCEMGFAVHPNKPVTLEILDGQHQQIKEFTLIPHDEEVWVPADQDDAVIEACKKGASFVLHSVSAKGTSIKDVYSLQGITAAYKGAQKALGLPDKADPAPAPAPAPASKSSKPLDQKPQSPVAAPASTPQSEGPWRIHEGQIISEPMAQEGAYTIRGRSFMAVTATGAVIHMGYPLKQFEDVRVSVINAKGALIDTFTFLAKGEQALAPAMSMPKILTAFKKGATLQVEGTSQKGTATKDTHSLKGFTSGLGSLVTVPALSAPSPLSPPSTASSIKASKPTTLATPSPRHGVEDLGVSQDLSAKAGVKVIKKRAVPR